MKAVFFDFDGTLTTENNSIWKRIWTDCGYSLEIGSCYQSLFTLYNNNLISYSKWVEITGKAFIQKNFNKDRLNNISKDIKLLKGVDKTLCTLSSKNIECHILSGGIYQSITAILGENKKYLTSINASNMHFDQNGYLNNIAATSFDFEGKANFISNYISKSGINANQIVFIGNSDNDEWVYQTGCKTVCVNPYKADINNKQKWSVVKENIQDFSKILPEIVDERSL